MIKLEQWRDALLLSKEDWTRGAVWGTLGLQAYPSEGLPVPSRRYEGIISITFISHT